MRDTLELEVSGADARGLAHLEKAQALFRNYIGDPLAEVEAAIRENPAMPMGYALKAWLYLLGTEAGGIAPARAAFLAAIRLPANRREALHLRAIACLLDGHWHEAARVMAELSAEFPRDLLALQCGHQLDFFTGESRMLRDRVARALPAWSEGMPGYDALLGMHAFGLEECGEYAAAEAAGRRAVELEPRNSWAQHAVAHVMEMQGRRAEGIAWMRADPEAWTRESFFAVHNWWHVALFHLALGETDEVLALYDGPIAGANSAVVLEMIDASAMLWRLMLRGVDVGNRWQKLAERWQPHAASGNYAFNDMHAMMAFVGAGRGAEAAEILRAQEEAMRRGGDNAMFTREVGHPATLAMQAFAERRYEECARLLRPVIPVAWRFGGSHAQRSLLNLTHAEADRRGRMAA
jgi:tetratricopeptide (TPR) repeat protein